MATDKPTDVDSVFGDVIYSYTRQQAIEDGVLIDVTEQAKEAGFKWPFAMTAEVWALIEDILEKYGYEDVKGRLWDVLNMALFEIKAGKQSGPEMFFEVVLHHSDGDRIRLKLHVGPGDDTAPVLTLMLPEQD